MITVPILTTGRSRHETGSVGPRPIAHGPTDTPHAVEAIRGLGADVLVPGHGPVCAGDDVPRVLDDMAEYVAFVDRLGRDAYAAGRTPLEAVREADSAGLGRFASWQEGERLVGNLWMMGRDRVVDLIDTNGRGF